MTMLRQVQIHRKLANNIAIKCLGPVIAIRDEEQTSSGLYSRFIRFLGRALKFVFYKTLQHNNGFIRCAYGVWLKERDDDTFRYCLRGNYGFTYSQRIAKYKQPFTFLDIGANIGLYSLLALKNPRSVAVHSFDPDSNTVPFLEANLRHSGSKNWSLHPVAISTTAGEMVLNKESGHSGASTLQSPTFADAMQESVTAVNQDYLNANIASDNSDILIKIDVEGHELSVLQALEQCTFMPRVREIFAEFDVNMSDPQAVQSWFEHHGFTEFLRIGDTAHWDALYVRAQEHPGGNSPVMSKSN